MKYSIMNTVARILVIVAFLWVGGGCATSTKTAESKPEEAVAEAATTPSAALETKAKPQESAPFVHTVRWQGESLSLIAKWYTGGYIHLSTLKGKHSGHLIRNNIKLDAI